MLISNLSVPMPRLISLAALLLIVSCGKSHGHDTVAPPPINSMLTGQGTTPSDQIFIPKFGEYVKSSFKTPRDFLGLTNIEMTEIVVVGGSFKNASCDAEICSIEILYNDNKIAPEFSFLLKAGDKVSQRFVVKPQIETVSGLSPERTILDGTNQFTITHGIDYVSSWNRPLAALNVQNQNGLSIVSNFECSVETCVAALTTWSYANPVLTWLPISFGGASSPIKSNIKIGKANIKALINEVTVDGGSGTEIVWEPGKGYLSAAGGVANSLYFQDSNPGVERDHPSCNDKGVCRVHLTYKGKDPFYALSYVLNRNGEPSEKQILKITPTIKVNSEEATIWKVANPWQKIVLKAGVDYEALDGEKAVSIAVFNSYDLVFENADVITNENRNKIFTCDAEGTCTASAKQRYSFYIANSITYSVQTNKYSSGNITRSFQMKSDELKFGNGVRNVAGAKQGITTEKFSLVLKKGDPEGYSSNFPAEKIIVDTVGEGIVFSKDAVKVDGKWESSCDKNGECRLDGEFLIADHIKTFSVHLQSIYGKSLPYTIRLVRQDRSAFFPAADAIVQMKNEGTDIFEFDVALNSPNGYQAAKAARSLRILGATGAKILDAEIIPMDNNRTEFEVPCNEMGSCKIKIQSTSKHMSIQYYLKGDGEERSFNAMLLVNSPELFAVPVAVSVPEGDNRVKFWVRPISTEADRIEIIGLENSSFPCKDSVCELDISLNEAFKVDEIRNYNYALFKKDVKSNEGPLTVTGLETFRLKPDFIFEAAKIETGIYTFSIQQDDLVPSTSPKLKAYFNKKIKVEMPMGVDLLESVCDGTIPRCDYKIKVEVEGESRDINMTLKGSAQATSFLKEGTFKVIVKK